MVGGEGVGWSRDNLFFFFQWTFENELLTSPHTRIANYKFANIASHLLPHSSLSPGLLKVNNMDRLISKHPFPYRNKDPDKK